MSEVEEKTFLTLEEILTPEATIDVYVEPLEKWVKIRSASTADRREAEKIAMQHPGWQIMNDDEKDLEIGKLLTLMILVEPKISVEDYMGTDDVDMQVILSAVASEYRIKLVKLDEQNQQNVKRFLQHLKERGLLSSTNSLNSTSSIGVNLEGSGKE